MTDEEALKIADKEIKKARLDLRQEQPKIPISDIDRILGRKTPRTDWREYSKERDSICPYWQKLDALGKVASWEMHDAFNAIYKEWRKEQAKELFPNDFNNDRLWLRYVIAKAKNDFIDNELEMWEPSQEKDWPENFDPAWEREIVKNESD